MVFIKEVFQSLAFEEVICVTECNSAQSTPITQVLGKPLRASPVPSVPMHNVHNAHKQHNLPITLRHPLQLILLLNRI
jgi:hypothetical protein